MAESNLPAMPTPYAFGTASSSSVDAQEFTFKCPFNTTSQPNPVVIDPDGDLLLTVGQDKCIPAAGNSPSNLSASSQTGNSETVATQSDHTHQNAVTFLVCSKALSRASRAWKCLLYGGFRESKPADGSQWNVHLPEDKIEPMTAILNIIHCRYDHVPDNTTITIESLYDITVLTEKYDLTHLLRPWCDIWVLAIGLDKEDLLLSPPEVLGRRLWISWVLGRETQFKAIATKFSMHSRLDSEGQLLGWPDSSSDIEPPMLDNIIMTPAIYEVIKENRILMINPLVGSLESFFQDPDHAFRGFRCNVSKCFDIVIGSLVRSLVKEGLWPLPDPSTYQDSPSVLKSKIQGLTIRTLHRDCIGNARWLLAVDRTQTCYFTTTDTINAHLEAQRRKLELAQHI